MKMKTLKPDQVKFVFYSIRERLALNELAKHMDWKVSNVSDEDGFDSWDVIYRDLNHPLGQTNVSEIKVRRRSSTDFNDWIFEKTKYDGLYSIVNAVGSLKIRPVFIVFFTDCTMLWDISKINKEEFKIQSLRSTSIDGNDAVRDKEVIYLNIEDGQKIDYIIDMDKLNLNAKTVFSYKFTNNTSQIINL